MRILRVALGGLLTAAVLAGPAIAFAADDEAAAPYLAVRGVDSTGGDVVRLTVAYEGDEGDLAGAVVTDNGSERPLSGDVVPLATTGASRAVVIAVDTSEAMDPVMADIRDSVTAVVEGLPGDVPVGIVTFNPSLSSRIGRIPKCSRRTVLHPSWRTRPAAPTCASL